MRRRSIAFVFWFVASTSLAINVLHAEDGVLVISVADPKGKPIAGVVLSSKGDGSTGSPTDISGKTRLRLAPQTRPGTWVTLQITHISGGRDLVIISPWDQRVIIPPFSNESENYVPLIIAERNSREVLASKDALAALAARIVAKPSSKSHRTSSDDRKPEFLAATALDYGLDPVDVDSAMRSWNPKPNDPYAKGLAAFYKGDLAEASAQLTQALKASVATSGRQRDAKIVDSAFFLGRALYDEGKYQEAANAFRQALQFRNDDVELLANLGLASINIQSQTATASEGSTVIQAQASTQYNTNYIVTVQREGTATSLISGASSTTQLESLLGFINREASAAFGSWEAQLRRYHASQNLLQDEKVTPLVAQAVASTRKELRDIQNQCATALVKGTLPEAKAQLFLLDGLASELAAKAGLTRPISR
jgi:tetratricopeptide (TPR) repeat protein